MEKAENESGAGVSALPPETRSFLGIGGADAPSSVPSAGGSDDSTLPSTDAGADEEEKREEALRMRRAVAAASARRLMRTDQASLTDVGKRALYRSVTKGIFGVDDAAGVFFDRSGDVDANLAKLRKFVEGDLNAVKTPEQTAWEAIDPADEESRYRAAEEGLKSGAKSRMAWKGEASGGRGPGFWRMLWSGMKTAAAQEQGFPGDGMMDAALADNAETARRTNYESLDDEEKAKWRKATIAEYERQLAKASPVAAFLSATHDMTAAGTALLARSFETGDVDRDELKALSGAEQEKVLTALALMRGDQRKGSLLFVPTDFGDDTKANRFQLMLYGLQQGFIDDFANIGAWGKAAWQQAYAKCISEERERRDYLRRIDLDARVNAALKQPLPDADTFAGAMFQGVAENAHWFVPYGLITKGGRAAKAAKGALALAKEAGKNVAAAEKAVAAAKDVEAAVRFGIGAEGAARQIAAVERYTGLLRTAESAAAHAADLAKGARGAWLKGRALQSLGRLSAFSSFAQEFIDNADADGLSREDSVPTAAFVGVINAMVERLYVPGMESSLNPAEIKSLMWRSAVEAWRHERMAGLRKWAGNYVRRNAVEGAKVFATEGLVEEELQQLDTEIGKALDRRRKELREAGRGDLADFAGDLWERMRKAEGSDIADSFGKAWAIYVDTAAEVLPSSVGFGLGTVPLRKAKQHVANRWGRGRANVNGDHGVAYVIDAERRARREIAAWWEAEGDEGRRPDGMATPNDALAAARRAFREAREGGGVELMQQIADAAGVDLKTAEAVHDALQAEAELELVSPRVRMEINLADPVAEVSEKDVKAILPGYVDGSFLADRENGLYSARLKLASGEERTLVYRIGDMSQWAADRLTPEGLADGGEIAASYEARRAAEGAEEMRPWSQLTEEERYDFGLKNMNGITAGGGGVFQFVSDGGRTVTVSADDVISLASGRLADVGYGARATGATLRHETFHALWRFMKEAISPEDKAALYSHFQHLDPKAESDVGLDEAMALEFERYASGEYVPQQVKGRIEAWTGWAMEKLGGLLDALGFGAGDGPRSVDGSRFTLKGFYDAVLAGRLGSGALGVELRDTSVPSPQGEQDGKAEDRPPEGIAAPPTGAKPNEVASASGSSGVSEAGSAIQNSDTPSSESNVRPAAAATLEHPATADVPGQRFYRLLAGDGVQIVGELVVSDVRDLHTSDKGDLTDASLQNRLGGKEREGRVSQIAAHPNPRLMGAVNEQANGGFVWTMPNGDVFIGNTRTTGATLAYEKGTAGELREHMLKEARERGIPVPEGVERPMVHFVLRRIESDGGKATIQDVVRMTNESTTTEMTALEKARNDADVVEKEGIAAQFEFRPDGHIDETKSGDAIGAFRRGTRAVGLVDDATDALTKEGQERIQSALLAHFLKGADAATVAKAVGGTDALDMANEMRALVRSGPMLEALARAKPRFDLRDAVAEILPWYMEWLEHDGRKRAEAGKTRQKWYERTAGGERKHGVSWDRFMAQGDMFRRPSEAARTVGDLLAASRDLRSFDKEDAESDAGKVRAQKFVMDYLAAYAHNAMVANDETDMFGTPPATREEMLRHFRENGGARFSIAGEVAASNMGIKGAADAEAMEKSGADREDIWRTTGWWKGKDGKWRFELPRMRRGAWHGDPEERHFTGGGDDFYRYRLTELVTNDDFFKAYPQAKKITVEFHKGMPTNVGGNFNEATLTIKLPQKYQVIADYAKYGLGEGKAAGLNEAGAKTIEHELQHAVQLFESFAKGGSPSDPVRPYALDGNTGHALSVFAEANGMDVTNDRHLAIIANTAQKITSDATRGEMPKRLVEAFEAAAKEAGKTPEEFRDEIERLYDSHTESPMGQYFKLAGEVEARNAQFRANMTPEERATTPPWETEDMPGNRQIVRYSLAPNPNLREDIAAALRKNSGGDDTTVQMKRHDEIVFSDNLPFFEFLGLPNVKVVTDVVKIRKFNIKHHLSEDQIAELPYRYNAPVAVMRDGTDGYVLLTELMAKDDHDNDKPVMVYLRRKERPSGEVIFIATAFAKNAEDEAEYYGPLMKSGLLFADENKIAGLALGEETESILRTQASGDHVLTSADYSWWSTRISIAQSSADRNGLSTPSQLLAAVAKGSAKRKEEHLYDVSNLTKNETLTQQLDVQAKALTGAESTALLAGGAGSASGVSTADNIPKPSDGIKGRRYSIAGGNALATAKLGEWKKDVDEDSVRGAIADYIDKGAVSGNIKLGNEGEKLQIAIAANQFFKAYSDKIVMLSDGRCAYFAPDTKNRERGLSNAECWAIYCVHAVTHGGQKVKGKSWNERIWSPEKAESMMLIEQALKDERCRAIVNDRDPSRDRVLFIGRSADGTRMDVMTSLDEYGNINADLTEVTVVMGRGNVPSTDYSPLTRAVEVVALHQADGYSVSTASNIPKPSDGIKGRRASIDFGDAYPQLNRLHDEDLAAVVLGVRLALGKTSEERFGKITKATAHGIHLKTVRRLLRSVRPDLDAKALDHEVYSTTKKAAKLARTLREDLDKGVTESTILRHLPATMRRTFGEEMKSQTLRGVRLGRFGESAEDRLEARAREIEAAATRNVTGIDLSTMEAAWGIDLTATLLAMPTPEADGADAGGVAAAEGTGGEGEAGDSQGEAEEAPRKEVDEKIRRAVQRIVGNTAVQANLGEANRKHAREAAGRDAEREAEMASEDGAGDGGASFAEGDGDIVAEAVAKEGVNVNSPLHFALLVKEMVRARWCQEHGLGQNAEPWHNAVAKQFLRRSAANIYARLGRDLCYSAGRETVMRHCASLENVPTVDGIVSEMEFIGRVIARWRIRDSQKRLCENIDTYLQEKFGAKGRFRPGTLLVERVKEATDAAKERGEPELHGVSAEAQLMAKYMRHAMWLSVEGAEREAAEIRRDLAAATVEFSENDSDVEQSRVMVDAVRKLNILREWGALQHRTPAEIEAAAEWWRKFYEGESDAIVGEWEKREERTVGIAAAFARGVRNPKQTHSRSRRTGADVANEYIQANYGGFMHLLRDLMRFADDATRGECERYLQWLELEIQKCGTRAATEKRKNVESFRKAVEAIYGKRWEKVVAELTEEDGRFEKFMGEDDDGVKVAPTRGRAMQLLASLVQVGRRIEVPDEENPGETKTVWVGGYHDNIVKHHREEQADELKRLLSPQDLKLIAWMRRWYEQNRAGLSGVSQRLFGIGVYAETGNYMPVKMQLDPQGLEKADGVGWTIFPKALTPRVKNERDFDTSADILEMWGARMDEAAQWKTHAALGLELRGIFGRAEFQKAVRASHGAAANRLVLGYITDILSGHGTSDGTGVKTFLDSARGWAAVGALGGNVGVMLKQMTSIPAFGFEIGAVKTATHFVTAFTPAGFAAMRRLIDSDERKNRWTGGNTEAVANAMRVKSPNALKRYLLASMITNKVGDIVPALVIGQGIYRDALERGMSDEDAMAYTWMLVERTQQSSRVENRAAFQRRNSIGNAIYQFLSTQQQYLNYEVRAVRAVLADKTNLRKWGNLANAAVLNHFVLSSLYYWMGQLYRALLGQEPPEDQLKDWVVGMILGPYGALYGMGITTTDAVNNWIKGYQFGKDNAVPSLSWLGSVIVRDPVRLVHDAFDRKKKWNDVVDDLGRWCADFNATFRDLRKIYEFRVKDRDSLHFKLLDDGRKKRKRLRKK